MGRTCVGTNIPDSSAVFGAVILPLLLSIIERFRAFRYRKDLHILLELLSPSKNDVILDVGAGSGWIASKVAEACDEVYAAEPNDARLDFIRKKHQQVKAFSATAQSIPFPDKYFNKIYIIFAFHHFPDQEDSLDEFNRILKAGGILLIQEYTRTSPGVGTNIERSVMKSSVKFLDSKELERMLTLHGFKIETARKGNIGYFTVARKEVV
jgi:ubiquinone/menaquinone biosynthesis C-methylase UbiE